MDFISFAQSMSNYKDTPKRVAGNPYPSRPWLQDRAAAAPASSNVGVKGIIAGIFLNYLY